MIVNPDYHHPSHPFECTFPHCAGQVHRNINVIYISLCAVQVRRVSSTLATGGPDAHKKDSVLLRLGVACLSPQQVVAVIERRL